MSKVYDNGTMRTATAEEEQNINMNIGGGTDRWELVDTKTITEDTSEYVYTFDSEKYDDVLVVGTDVSGTNRMNISARIKAGQYRTNISGNAITFSGTSALSIFYKFVRELAELYYTYTYKSSDITTIILPQLITNSAYIGKKIESVRINASPGDFITGGTFRIYGKVRSEFL